MKILLITPEFPPNYTGGGGIVFENLAKTYQKQGHKVLVISGDYTKKNIFSSLKIKKEQEIDIVRIPEFYTPLSLLNTVMPYPFWYNISLKRIIKDYSPDFIHIHGYGLFMPAQGARLCRKLKKQYTFTIHGAPVSPEKMKNPIISAAYKFYHKFYGFPLLDGAKKLTAVSTFAKNFDIFKKYREKIEVIGNGINPDEYKKVDTDIFTQRGIRKDQNTKIILSLGRIEWIKGFEEIIKIIPSMIDEGYDVEYCIGGRNNGYKEKLEMLAKDLGVTNRVHYLGFIEKNIKMSSLQYADVVAIPSKTETYGMVALEARIFKKPVVTTFSGGLKDALADYKGAFMLEDFEKAFSILAITDKNINDFYWDEIARLYLFNGTKGI